MAANLPPTTTALGSAPNPSLAGRNVIFTATVRTNGVAAGDATGAVVFKEGLSALSTNAVSGGVATYTNTSFGPGAHGLTAEYSGDAQYAGSFSGTVTQIVQAATTLALTPSSNPSTVSNNLTLTATVQTNGAPAGGAGGTVVFKEGGTPLWTTNVTGGVAVFTTSGLAGGSHALTAEYGGDAYYLASTNSPALAQVVYPQILIKTVLGQGADATAAEDAHADNSSGTGTIAYRFTNPSGTTGDRHQSTILRFDLSQIAPGSISSATLNLVNWRNANTPANPVRIYGLNDGNARENWDEYGTSYTANNIPGFRSDSATTDLDLGTDPIDTNAVTVLNGSYSLGTPAKGSASAVLNGGAFLTWLKADTNGLVTVILDPYRTDTAAVNLTVFGSKDTTALEGGSPVGAPGDFAAYLVLGANVRAVPTTTALASSGSPSTLGNNVTFTATVQTNGVTAGNAGGTLVFKAGAVGLGTAPVTGGVASLTTSAVPFGTNLVTAVYVGDANHLGSTSLAVEQVVPLATTTVITLGSANPLPNNGLGGDPFFTAEVRTNGVTAGAAEGTLVFKEGTTVLASIPLVGGTAVFSTPTLLIPGWHYVTAEYSGASLYLASTSAIPAAQAVYDATNQAATTMTVGSSLNPSVVGNSVTFTATVHTNFGAVVATAATGTVLFKDGAVTLGSGGVTNGLAHFITSALAIGVRALTAEYSGDAAHGPTPGALVQTVQAPTTTVLASGANPSTNGVNVIFTATVQTNGATAGDATGTVNLYDGVTYLTTVTVANGVAKYTNNSLALGAHALEAQYSGDSVYLASTNSPALTQVVGLVTTMALAASANPSAVGNPLTFTATVRTNGVAAGDATGTVVFKDSGTPLSTNTVTGGVAAYTTNSLAAGSHSITAEYRGDTNYLDSTSLPLAQVIEAGMATATALVSSGSPSWFGSNVTFTATVQSNGVTAGNAAGTVVFSDGATALSTNTVTSGVARYTNHTLGVGPHLITARYSGGGNYVGSLSLTVTQIVQTTTTLALTPSSNPSTVSNALIFTASVQTNGATAGGATGSVVFKDAATVMGVNPVTGGVATYTDNTLAVGSHSITAEYSGDAYYLASTNSQALTQVVKPQIVIKTLFGQGADATVNENAHTDGGFIGVATSIAYRFSNPSDPTGDRHNSAFLRFDLSQIAPGSISSASLYLITYRGQNNPGNPVRIFGLNHGNERANWPENAISYTANNIPGFRSDAATTDLDLGTDPIDTNAVTVLNGSYNLGTVNEGTATAVLSGSAFLAWLNAATNGIVTVILDPYRTDTATVGLTTFGTKEAMALENNLFTGAPGDFAPYLVLGADIQAVPTATTLASSGSPTVLGSNVTFTATVQTNGVRAANARGTMAFKSGTSGLGSVGVTNGVASFSTGAVPVGQNLVTAVYVGDANHLGSSSEAVTQVVQGPTATVIAAVGNNPIVVGDTATFQADVQTNGVTAGDAGGTMVFKEGGTLLDSIPVSNGQASYNLNTLTPGWHYLTAQYSGDGVYLASTSSVPAAQAVSSLTQTATTLTLASSLNPSTNGDSVTFTATVHTNFGVDVAVGAGGTVVFKDGAVTLGSRGALNGVASFSTTALAAGAHALTAEYSGNATYGPSPAALAQVVAQPSLPNTPTSISYSVGGGSLTLSWPASYLGWILQGQTNALEVGLGANWADLAGTESVTSTNLPLGPGNPAVFYRLRHP